MLGLSDEQEIEALAGYQDPAERNRALAMASMKQTKALEELASRIFNAQKHISQRLDNLNEQLSDANKQSGKLARKTVWLTAALVVAAFAQVAAPTIVAWLSVKK